MASALAKITLPPLSEQQIAGARLAEKYLLGIRNAARQAFDAGTVSSDTFLSRNSPNNLNVMYSPQMLAREVQLKKVFPSDWPAQPSYYDVNTDRMRGEWMPEDFKIREQNYWRTCPSAVAKQEKK